MISFKVSTTVDQKVDIVVEALMNPDNFPFWQTDLKRFEVVRGKPGEVGAVGHLHYRQKGKSYIMEDRLVYCEPGRKYVSEVTGDALNAHVETILVSSGGKTEMSLTWSGEGTMLLLKALLPFLKGRMIRQSKKELEKFKQLIETKGSNFGT